MTTTYDLTVSHVRIGMFSPRQRDVLRRLLQGHRAPEIAERLDLTYGTVSWHLDNLYGLTGARGGVPLMAWANVHRDCCGLAELWPEPNGGDR